jgi:hypothetical protein
MATPYVLGCDLSVPTYTWSAGVNSSFPVSNLKTYFAADVSKSNSTSADQYLTIDFGAATACTCIVLGGHNFISLELTEAAVVLQVNTDDNTTWDDPVTIATINLTGDPLAATFNSTSKRYWRLLFAKAGDLPSAPSIGNIFLGTRTTFTSTYEWDFAKENKAYETMESTSINGDIRTSQVFSGRGRLRPFFFVDADSTVNYVHLENDYNEVKNFRYNQNNLRIQMKEQVAS